MRLPQRTLAALSCVALAIAVAGAAPPANDGFADRELLAPDLPLVVSSSTVDATAEPDFDPSNYGGRYLFTVWYEWTAGADGLYALRGKLTGAEYNSWRLNVISADDGGELTTIAAGLSYSTTTNESVYFRAAAGQSVQFVLGSLQPGEFELSLREAAPSAAGLVDLDAAVPQTISRSRGYQGHDLAWQWLAPADGLFVFDYFESFLRTGIVPEFFVQDAATGALPEPLFGEYWAEIPSGTGYHYFRAQAGRQYRIIAAAEEVEFTLERLPDAAHANLGLAEDLGMVDAFVVRGHNAQAGSLPWPEGTAVGPWQVAYSLGAQWWQWRAPAPGNYRIRSGPSRDVRADGFWYPPQAWVFTGNSGATLKAAVTSPSWSSIGQGDLREVSYLIHAERAGSCSASA